MCCHYSVVPWCRKLSMPRPQSHTTFLRWEGLGRGTPTCFCEGNSSPLPLASDVDGLHTSTDVFFFPFMSPLRRQCHMTVQGYTLCQGRTITPLTDLCILMLPLPALRAGLVERMQNILGILQEHSGAAEIP